MAEIGYGRAPIRNIVGTVTKVHDPTDLSTTPISGASAALPGGGTVQPGIILSLSVDESPASFVTLPDTIGDVEGIIIGEVITTISVSFEPRYANLSGGASPNSSEARLWKLEIGDLIAIHDTAGNQVSQILNTRSDTDTNNATCVFLVTATSETGAIQQNRVLNFTAVQYGGSGISKID